MADLEKVIKGLKCCLNHKDCNPWGYCAAPCEHGVLNDGDGKCFVGLIEDSFVLLSDPDRVRVVRCSDCRFWEPPTDIEADDGSTAGHCRNDYAPCQNQQTDMDWFCADGEREE